MILPIFIAITLSTSSLCFPGIVYDKTEFQSIDVLECRAISSQHQLSDSWFDVRDKDGNEIPIEYLRKMIQEELNK